MNERVGLKLEHCRQDICRLIRLCGYPDLCGSACLQQRALPDPRLRTIPDRS